MNGKQRLQLLRPISWVVVWLFAALDLWCAMQSWQAGPAGVPYPGSRVVLDAHNCYPYGRRWADRMDRALATGMPVAIEQDLAWYTDPRTGSSWSVLSHSRNPRSSARTMRQYFFERVRPIVEEALRDGNRGDWPLITLNLDFKNKEPEHLKAVWRLLGEYEDWITSAPRLEDIYKIAPLEIRPILVLTGESKAEEDVFYDQVPEGGRLLVFGATPSNKQDPCAPPQVLAPEPMNNYRRWWNNPWRVVEPRGRNAEGTWSDQDEERLNELVQYAHERGFWIRFYTLNGISAGERCDGWSRLYNLGSLEAARIRWRAAIRAGVDFLSTDQYEELARELGRNVPENPGMTFQQFGWSLARQIRKFGYPASR